MTILPVAHTPPRFYPRPALPIALALIAGIGIGRAISDRSSHWLVLASAAIVIGFLFKKSIVRSAAIILAAIALGMALAQMAYFRGAADDIGNFAADDPALVQIRLSIDHAPVLVYPPPIAGRSLPPRQIAIARAESVHGANGWVRASGTVFVQLARPDPWLRQGQHVQAIGLLGHFLSASNPGQTDWAEEYRERGIFASLEVAHADNVEIIGDDGLGPIAWLQQEARHLLSSGFTVRRMADYALLRALVLGDSDPDSRDVQDAFAQIGLAYQLSISGLHIVVLAACAYAFCRLTGLSPRWTIGVTVAIVLLYGAIALPTTSARRAVFICVAFLIAPLVSRSGDKLQLLSLAAIGLLVIDPMELGRAGFQLGFVTVTGLTLFSPRLLPKRRKSSRFQAAIRMLWAWMVISAIAWVISLPLVAARFGSVSPWAIAAGVVLFPIVLLALLGGWAKMIATLLWPSVAPLAARVVQVPAFVMRLLAVRLTHLPGASIAVTSPPTWMIFLYYGLLAATLIRFSRPWMIRLSRFAAAVGVIGLMLTITGITPAGVQNASNELTVTLLSVGAGQCAIVSVPGENGVTLIDCGSDSVGDVARSILLPAMQVAGERSIARIILTHSDYDHISAMPSLLGLLHGPVYTSDYFARFAAVDPPAEAMLRKLEAMHRSPTILRQGEQIAMGPATAIDVLWPRDGLTMNVNDTGLVLRLRYGGRSILFPADIQVNAMRAISKEAKSLHADVLVAAHHGSSETTTDAFVRAVDPKFIVASNGLPLTGKQQKYDQLVTPLKPLYRTSQFGAITIHLRSDGQLSITTFLTQPRGSAAVPAVR